MPQRKGSGPSVKNKDQYEELRKQGNSKEKAARIANASAKQGSRTVGKRGGKSASYDDMSKQELYDRAKRVGIEGRSSMSKSELVEALRDH